MKRRLIVVYIVACGLFILCFCILVTHYLYAVLHQQPRCSSARPLTEFIESERRLDGDKIVTPQRSAKASVGLLQNIGVKVMEPTTVFYVWCGATRRPFEFRNYLSVLSTLRTLRPNTIWFYYESEPAIDHWLYNTWWQELIDSLPFFHPRPLRELDSHLPNSCIGTGTGRPSTDFIYALVTSRGGTYVEESTIVLDLQLADEVTMVAVDAEDKQKVLFFKSNRDVLCSLAYFYTSPVHVLECQSDSLFTYSNSTFCVYLHLSLFPKDIWTLDSDLGRVLRREFYGNSSVVRPLPSLDSLSPNIGHVIWVGGCEMNFLFFLCVLSLLHVAKVNVVYVHGDQPPTGAYWDLIVATHQNVQLVLRENVGQVYGQAVGSSSHLSDVWRADIMLKYGGIYVDTDVIFTRPLSTELRAYDVVASFDWIYWYPPFPDIVNLGVVVAKPGATFWKLCLESMKWFIDDDFSWNGLRQPYRVLERHPNVLHIEQTLQVICFKGLCHPTWWPNYHDKQVNHESPPPGEPPLDASDAFAFHFTYPLPPILSSPRALLQGRGLYAEIGKMVLDNADMLTYFQLD